MRMETASRQIKERVMTELIIRKIPSVEDRSLPVFDELDRLMQAVEHRAYEIFEGRGRGVGHDLDDWLAAERELCGPELEVTEDEAGFRLEVPVGDFEQADIEVTATPCELIVRAARDGEARRELLRRVRVATPVAVEAVTATVKDGRLILTAPKAVEPEARVVPIQAAA
jgi:HSP20 family molecular chaperone IbpA